MNTELYALAMYVAYLVTITAVTFAVASMLSRHGAPFIRNGCEDDEHAKATGAFLRTQFLLTVLPAMLTLTALERRPSGPAEAIEMLSIKIGVMLLVVGAAHFVMMRLIDRVRRTGNIL